MSEQAVPSIDVYLIGGFLGSGKTTFLNRLMKQAPPDRKLMILMNEFGEVGIDGTLIEDPELDVLEISKGSIFCSCVKGDFIKGLYRIVFTYAPDLLLIEASGVANPSDFDRDLVTPIFKGALKLRQKFCLVDAANFLEHFEVFTAVEKQIAHSDLFLINKIDLAEAETIARVKALIREYNPAAEFYETTYADLDFSSLFGPAEMRAGTEAAAGGELLSEDELEAVVDRMLEDETAQVTPPDRLISISCRWRDGSLAAFRAVAESLPEDVVRAKGFVFEEGRAYLYSRVGRSYEILPYQGRVPGSGALNQVVFIRREFNEEEIKDLFVGQGLELLAPESEGS